MSDASRIFPGIRPGCIYQATVNRPTTRWSAS